MLVVMHKPGYGAVNIFTRNDSLFARIGDKLLWLQHDNYDVFDFFEIVAGEEIDTADSGPTRMQFLLSKKGEVDRIAIDLEGGLEPLIFKRQLEAKPVTRRKSSKIYRRL